PLLISAQRKAAPQRGALHSSNPIPPAPGAGMRFMESVAEPSRSTLSSALDCFVAWLLANTNQGLAIPVHGKNL
ncbi:MAG: hypothetical protein KDI66_13545, partial [Xanthomonadales bacterium]|nr:hypothetical protein [Xanthomonadales bacterium]